MHILVPVFFKAPLGGLHSHVYAQAKAIIREGWRCTILCKPGPFAQQCRDSGIEIIEDDFSDLSKSIAEISESFKFDLIHAHPFASREIGQGIAKNLNIPILLTVHGKYTDTLVDDCDEFSRIYCVSLGVRDHLVKNGIKSLHKIFVYPNAVNTEVFYAGHESRLDRLKEVECFIDNNMIKGCRIIIFSCRMGIDKKFILNCVKDAWIYQARYKIDSWRWIVAGDGPGKADLELAANELNEYLGHKCITFLGWQSEDKLNALYQSADLVVAPGRSALDCLASNRPVIAIGSQGYIGAIDEGNWYKGSYSNFGGVGEKDYISGELFQDINSIIYDDEKLDSIGKFGRKRVLDSHDQKYWDVWLLDQYREIMALYDEARSLSCELLEEYSVPDT
ncbi:glycosyltransferase family 4 protein [Microbulbifer variabilis]|uniref:Glycosyltransferase family 4 protein n=1 Tax=Microbulbifer variabilis TaxID=266805 RepID=A0ABY4VFQ2_9GAMM|nr:glycosyltransferase family 4 protein [Microbulbifer variabilis]USD23107.1 glycosyltransferase family 4 protein [Microbulbifer variabilis]